MTLDFRIYILLNNEMNSNYSDYLKISQKLRSAVSADLMAVCHILAQRFCKLAEHSCLRKFPLFQHVVKDFLLLVFVKMSQGLKDARFSGGWSGHLVAFFR